MRSINRFIMKDHPVAFSFLGASANSRSRRVEAARGSIFVTSLPIFFQASFGMKLSTAVSFSFSPLLRRFFIPIGIKVLISTAIAANTGGPVPSVGNFLEFILQVQYVIDGIGVIMEYMLSAAHTGNFKRTVDIALRIATAIGKIQCSWLIYTEAETGPLFQK